MRQKYEIIQDSSKKFRIREYAIIDKDLKNIETSLLRPEDYAFLHEETYERPVIVNSISDGIRSLVSALRTPTFFPSEHNAAKIAESFIELYKSRKINAVEVFVDDINNAKIEEQRDARDSIGTG